MTAGETLAELDRRGVVLEPNGDTLRYKAPQGTLTPELRNALLDELWDNGPEILLCKTTSMLCDGFRIRYIGGIPYLHHAETLEC